MKNNRTLTLYTARSRKDTTLQAAPMSVEDLFLRLGSSQPVQHTSDAYKALKKAQQDELKDVGAYIAGDLKSGHRRRGCVLTRSAAVLDADNLPAGSTKEFLRRVAALGCCYCVHSTAKHTPATPRLRVVIPFGEDIPAEQYSPVVRMLCRLIQPEMAWFDPTCAEPGRIMYYPAHCLDVTPVYIWEDKPFLDAAAMLARLQDWRDVTTWPAFPREQSFTKAAAKQQDPESKGGIVGAFCRVYDVPTAMAKFLPGVYEETATPGRYTFLGGSTTGGAMIYDNGKFLFSHHATDPAGGKLVNAFDLVRLHLFGELDDEAAPGVRGNRLSSYQAMCDFARKDDAAGTQLARETFNSATDTSAADEDAALALGRCAGDKFRVGVLRTALRALGVQVKRNVISNKIEISNMPAPYSKEEAINTLPVLLWDLLHKVDVRGANEQMIRRCLAIIADENRYNPVLDMLHTTMWDGTHRFTELLHILGIDPDSFYALLVRKWLIQCVALAHNNRQRQEAAEGVLTLQGAQGTGKTTVFRRLAVRIEWLAEGITLDMRSKDSIINAVSAWIAELGELEGTLKKEQESLKAFVTQKVDRVRAPYTPEAVERLRRTSFGATVNSDRFLKDDTGTRRFWVVPVEDIDLETLTALPDEWFIQLWAEVYNWWLGNPQGFRLSRTEREHLNELNREHRETLPYEEDIRQLLNFDLPKEQWKEVSASQLGKMLFLGSYKPGDAGQIGRVLRKLEREKEGITRRILDGVSLYLLPLVQSTVVIR